MISLSNTPVVYLFGAGASARALPTVANLPRAIDEHINWLVQHAVGDVFDQYRKALGELKARCIQFGTPDTYARSLFLKADERKLRDLKALLTTFFALEQTYGRPAGPNSYNKESGVDTRYMGWLALLLGKEGVAPNVHVVSWNYDLQVEHALELYGREVRLVGQTAIADARLKTPTETQDYEPAFLLHLNGIAGHRLTSNFAWERFYPPLEKYPRSAHVRHLLQAYEHMGLVEPVNAPLVDEAFTFAWEDKPLAVATLRMACKVLREAEVLVIIGYSFPAFNRSVDIQLLRAFATRENSRHRKRIFIQNPTLTAESFVHQLGSVLGRVSLPDEPASVPVVPPLPVIHIECSADTAQFYLPPELFN